ncbi:hypothetical protein K505DRAFT_8530 [Melanomma pulvis-pyrius CBS 109.77]|uniref:Uncharacterized protein n=1 Tax=Melanomma pulvis-pyrius CBS 109.77 TaxID=1314802 RepID=A0A6A6XH26_9PLEO|nr:hypothetical protein K505DRAFT_8530 [Melanomma pulvis-pyrius CBS 109.77]
MCCTVHTRQESVTPGPLSTKHACMHAVVDMYICGESIFPAFDTRARAPWRVGRVLQLVGWGGVGARWVAYLLTVCMYSACIAWWGLWVWGWGCVHGGNSSGRRILLLWGRGPRGGLWRNGWVMHFLWGGGWAEWCLSLSLFVCCSCG